MTILKELRSGVLSKVSADEPIFVLRAKDVLAPQVIRYWARLARLNGSACKAAAAEAFADEVVDSWQLANGSKIPD